VRRGLTFLAVFSACLVTGVAGATSQTQILGRSTVTAIAADGDDVAFVAARTSADCDRLFIWQRLQRRLFQLGKHQRCAPRAAPVSGLTVSGGRALWITPAGGKILNWQVWTATTTRRTPRQLDVVTRDLRVDDRQPIILGSAAGGSLPYAVDTTVTALRANGSIAFLWTASSPVIALAAAADGRVAVAEGGGRVTVVDSQGKIVSVDLYASDVSAVAFVSKGLVVQRGAVLEWRRGTEAHEYTIDADAHLSDAEGKWAAWSDGKLVHVIRISDGVQTATFAGSGAALASGRLYVASGRTITVRTIR
jgi:hypothetical protein